MGNTSNLFCGYWIQCHNMINCEQFIYTAAKTKLEKGYQIISKSDGITEDILSQLRNYFYPLGVKHSQFKESRSLLLLKENKIAFSIIKNIGIGFDGRPDAIYNHTLIITKDDFQKINNDTRILEKYYLENSKTTERLPIITIQPSDIPIEFSSLEDSLEILPKILFSIFRNEKTIVFGHPDYKLIQNILSLIPSSTRLIPFSTLVHYPSRQPKYNFILTTKDRVTNLDSLYVKIATNRKSSKNIGNTLLAKSVNYLIDIIKDKEYSKIKKIHNTFDDINGSDIKSKLILVTNYEQLISTKNEHLKQEFADNMLEVIKKIDKNDARKYLEKIKQYSPKYTLLENQIKNVISPSMSFIDALILLPMKFTADLISGYVEFQKTKRKVRD